MQETQPFRHTRNANPLTRVRVAKHPGGASLAKQSFRDECNINKILKKFEKNGTIDHQNTTPPIYGDFIAFEDYHTSLNKILEAQDAFAQIPSEIRSKFQNNPAEFLEFAQNPENLDQMIEMGLAPKRPPVAPEPPKASIQADALPSPPPLPGAAPGPAITPTPGVDPPPLGA